MAMFPCDVGAHRYNGTQQTIYPALSDGANTQRRKLRLCPRHFTELVEKLEHSAQRAQLEFDEKQTDECLNCHGLVRDLSPMFFATVYATRTEREDYYAPVHGPCVAEVVVAWQLPA